MPDRKKRRETKPGPYEKFLEKGASHLSEEELLAVILRTGTAGEDTVSIAKKILALPGGPKGSLLGLYHVTLKELMNIKGIGQVKAIKLKCVAELSVRISQAFAKDSLQFESPGTIAGYYMERLRHRDRECVLLLMLDGHSHLIGEQTLSEGTVTASLVSNREIFMTALKNGAVYIMLLHNHPGGDPEPSRRDIAVTEQIVRAAKLMEIPLLDHIIIGDKTYFSFKEVGYL